MDLRKQFLSYLNQSESCELFYNYMKCEHLAYVLEFYLACDGLKKLLDDKNTQRTIIELIYKHYLSNGKCLSSSSSSSSKKFSLTNDLLYSIKQRLIKHEYHIKFYEQAQEYVLKYMLQMCYPKFLIEQQNVQEIKRQALSLSRFNPMYRRSISTRKQEIFDKLKQQSNNSLEPSTLIVNNEIELNNSKQSRLIKKNPYDLAQRNPTAFFEEIKNRLLAYQIGNRNLKNEIIDDDDPFAILDLQIAKTIDDADNCLFQSSITYRNNFTRYDSGVGTDSSEKNYEIFSSEKQHLFIDVIWYPSLDSNNALLSTIPHIYNQLTFKEFRHLFNKQTSYRYFFKTICSPDINKEQYVFRELTMDDELIPFYNGKIFVQLDRLC
ncbi:unnamed protein product [Adineta steineri]|uniref:RGS domain-containing protein n=1 Tax=Adineta steineri TaxID=433720 RepID=A0A815DJY7_9BILA|nr:unnamed protein product [Adineta steineri]CAF1298041.1 unnamed protein product [Adineta steineri]